jgi:hypothetical protein
MPRKSKKQTRSKAKAKGFRSGFEVEVAGMLDALGVDYTYETEVFPWTEDLPNGYCPDCGCKAVANRTYTPDFFLDNGTIIEAKGIFTVKDRKIALAMKEMGTPTKLLFMWDNKLSRKSKTRYSDWCQKNDVDFSIRKIKEEWLT